MDPNQANISRRTFLAGTASVAASAVPVAAAMGVLASTENGLAWEPSGEEKTLGFALVGIGNLSMGQLLPAFAKCKTAKPVALVSGHPDKAKEQATKYGIDPKNIYNYENFDSIKDNPAIDVVYIVLPNSMHAEYTIRAAKAGKHVLCEKPMANSVEDCQAMIDACKAANRKLMIGYRLRYEPMTQKAIALARSAEEMGDVKQITAEAGFNIANPDQWRLNRKLAGGGPLMDMGIYGLNAIRYLSGQEPIEVSAVSYATPGDVRFKEVEETISFELRFASGLLASCLTSYGFNCNRFRVYGTEGQLECEPFQAYQGSRLWQTHARSRQQVSYQPVNHFAAEMDDFCRCILADQESLTPGEEGLKDLKVMMAAYESANAGKAIKIG
jgi:predicted dehydrogenase